MIDDQLTSLGAVVGTFAYMSPEQVQAKELDARSDLFSFGTVLYEMATGHLPFRGESPGVIFEAILNRAPIAPTRLNPALPSEMEHVIDKSLEKNRNLRYQHASEIGVDLARLRRASETDGVERSGALIVPKFPRKGVQKKIAWTATVVTSSLIIIFFLARQAPRPAQSHVASRLESSTPPVTGSASQGGSPANTLAEKHSNQSVVEKSPAVASLVAKTKRESSLETGPSPTSTPSSTAAANKLSGVVPKNFGVGKFSSFIVSDTSNIWIAIDDNNTVTKLRANDGVVLGTIAAGKDPRGIAIDGGNVWIANHGDNTVKKVRSSDGNALGLYQVGSKPIGIASDGANIWLANSGSNSVTKLRASDGSSLADVAVGISPYAIAFDGANIWITNERSNNVTKINVRTDAVVGTFPVGASPTGITFDGSNVWVANSDSNSVTKLQAKDGTVLGTFPAGIAPRDLAFDGISIWVANNGSDTVTKLRAADGAPQGSITVGSGPRHIVFDGSHIWVSTAGNFVTKF